jgi:hypothetical protein
MDDWKDEAMRAKAKIVGLACAVALVGTVGISSAFAVGYGGAGFVDANGDGVCNRMQAASSDATASGSAGTGCCMQCQTASTDGTATGVGCGAGANFTDENGDGVCDNVGTGACESAGCCYADANGDDVCDRAGSGAGAGMGGRGFHGGR